MVMKQLTYLQRVRKLTGLYMSLTENVIWLALLSHLFNENFIIFQIFTKLHDMDYFGIESKELPERQNNLCLKITCIL